MKTHPGRRRVFPDPRETDDDGVVAVGGDFSIELLSEAYLNGIFPWPDPSYPEIIWCCPKERAILEKKDFTISTSLKKTIKRSRFSVTFDKAFFDVMRNCQQVPRPGQSGTWILDPMLGAYLKLHEEGLAHSVEVWRDEKLAGGLYGVSVGGVFAGESMFHVVPNASKIALVHLMEYLFERGLSWIDIQQLTPHMQAMGAKNISRDQYLKKLFETQEAKLRLF